MKVEYDCRICGKHRTTRRANGQPEPVACSSRCRGLWLKGKPKPKTRKPKILNGYASGSRHPRWNPERERTCAKCERVFPLGALGGKKRGHAGAQLPDEAESPHPPESGESQGHQQGPHGGQNERRSPAAIAGPVRGNSPRFLPRPAAFCAHWAPSPPLKASPASGSISKISGPDSTRPGGPETS